MLLAHVGAVIGCAVIIATADRFAVALSRAVRAGAGPIRLLVAPLSVGVVGGSDQPLRSALEPSASMSHRGPPVRRAG
jgi:hypothetical protein